jgi:hypothetical protein
MLMENRTLPGDYEMESTLSQALPLVKTGPTFTAPAWALAALMFVLLASAFAGAVALAAR